MQTFPLIARRLCISASTRNSYKNIIVEDTDRIFKITFNRPAKKNALTHQVIFSNLAIGILPKVLTFEAL